MSPGDDLAPAPAEPPAEPHVYVPQLVPPFGTDRGMCRCSRQRDDPIHVPASRLPYAER